MRQILCVLIILASFYVFPACTKNVTTTVHDTTTLIYKDTIVKKDTTVKIDTLVVTNPKNPITGLWAGTYQLVGLEYLGSFYYAYDIFSDGTFIAQGGGTNGAMWTGKGTWTLSADSTFTANLTPGDISQGSYTEHITAKYSSAAGTLSQGLYVASSNTVQSGEFLLKRVND